LRIAVENLLSSYLLSKNVRINVHKATILTVVLYGFETWPLLLRKSTHQCGDFRFSQQQV
jgi:hypothetical protein